MGDDPVGVVGENVVSVGVEFCALMEAEREVSSIETPQREAAEEVGAATWGGSVYVGVGEEAVEEVWEEDGPCEWDCKKEPE